MRTPLAFLLALLICLAVPATASAADPLRPQQWGLDMIHADAAHQTSTGSGVVVAVVDTGVLASHEDLQGQLVAGRDFVQSPNDDNPQDENGHGTHVSGIIAAAANNGKGIEGVAPGAKVMPIRVLDANGEGDADTVAKGIDWAVDHHADVINLSLGGDAVTTILGGDEKFTASVQNALNKGVVVVAAAGNDTAPFCEQPSVTGPLLCVGAVDPSGIRAAYSSNGDIFAPGGSGLGGSSEDVLSTYNDGNYESIAGTSQATPHVAGVAALLESLGLRGQAVVNRIKATAAPADPVLCPMCGAGILDAKAAVAGLGGSSGGGNNGGSSGGGGTTRKAGLSYSHTQKIKKVLKSGVKATCKPTKSGRCKVRVKAKGKLIASGSRKVGSSGKWTVSAKVTSAGRKMLKNAKKVNATLTATVPGGGQRGGGLKLVR